MSGKIWTRVLGAAWLLLAVAEWRVAAAAEEPGLIASYRSLEDPRATDVLRVDHPGLLVASGDSPTPFLPPGRFEVKWSGFIRMDLRSNCSFEADVDGEFELSLNGMKVMESRGDGGPAPTTSRVRLNKGSNRFEAMFRSPAEGGGMLRLSWTDGEAGIRPVSKTVLSSDAFSEPLNRADLPRHGRELFFEFRCGRCHTDEGSPGVPDAALPASSLKDVGARRNAGWMARWVMDPQSFRKGAKMPRMVHGMTASEDAAAIAGYLSSLGSRELNLAEVPGTGAMRGRGLFERLHCAACHDLPGGESTGKVGLSRLRSKFAPGSLVEFLRSPEAHFEWIRMPNFGLSEEEAESLAAYLEEAGGGEEERLEGGVGDVLRGETLVATLGCLSCHDLGVENRFKVRGLGEMGSAGGCLGEVRDGSKHPVFALAPEERAALSAVLRTDRDALGRGSLADFAERQVRWLSCGQCHGEQPGIPLIEEIGGKLKPEWMSGFMGGRMGYKPRPWLEARMPAFGVVRSKALARGLAMREGFPPDSSAPGPVDRERAGIGRSLIGKGEGFACVACHAVGEQRATDVFDAEGINLAHAAERLHYAYFRRWLLDPLSIDPATKMPDYFDGLVSPFTEVYGGDAMRQVESMWEYIRLGPLMAPPATEE